MLILDKQLAIERMVSVASRPRVPAVFRRPDPAIEAVLVPSAATGAPQRRLAGVLVLAGGHGAEREPSPEHIETLDAPSFVHAPPIDAYPPHKPPMLLPELHLLPEATSDDPGTPMTFMGRLARLFRVAPRSTTPVLAQRPYAYRDAGRIHAWHARPVDVS